MAYRFYVNSDIVFGRDSVKELPGILKGYGAKKVMVVYDAGVKAAGIAEQVLAMVEETSIPYDVFDGVIPNPTNEVVEEAAGLARCNGVDAFVAVGGGSSIDLAKAIDVLMTNPGSIGDYAGIGKVRHPLFPLVAIPTIRRWSHPTFFGAQPP